MQQTQVITVTQRLTSVALLYEMSSFAFVPMNLSRKLCLALIWLTENEKINFELQWIDCKYLTNLCTTVGQDTLG